MRPKRKGLSELIKIIEELYSSRFSKDTAYFKSQISSKKEKTPDIPEVSFPSFVYDHLHGKHKIKKVFD
jgi:hypothetical protein